MSKLLMMMEMQSMGKGHPEYPGSSPSMSVSHQTCQALSWTKPIRKTAWFPQLCSCLGWLLLLFIDCQYFVFSLLAITFNHKHEDIWHSLYRRRNKESFCLPHYFYPFNKSWESGLFTQVIVLIRMSADWETFVFSFINKPTPVRSLYDILKNSLRSCN